VELDFLVNGGDFSASGDSISSKFLENVAENGFPAIVSTVLSVASKLDTNGVKKKLDNLSISNNVSPCPLCRKQTIEKLCEPCNRLMSQIPSDKQSFILNAVCPVE
jgi:uroporphyrinogen-III decarboxylase